ncbi:MAG: hypothetical protein KIH04_10530 [Candidatus Freyarchaeota archaeon]|nr:hypothetical protein [Candidatus Jordarchaeia archaeon]
MDSENFRMNGYKILNAPHGFPDTKNLIEANIVGVKSKASIYGPVYSKKVISYALNFISDKTGEGVSEKIETLEQLAEYLLSKTDKYPTSYCSIVYADIKTEVELQGEVGAATRIGEMGWWRGFKGDPAERNVNVEKLLLDVYNASISLKLCPKEFGYKVNSDGTADLLLPSCYYKDACLRAFSENILRRVDGRMMCPVVSSLCQFFKFSSGYDWDYDLIEFNKPHCIAKAYML